MHKKFCRVLVEVIFVDNLLFVYLPTPDISLWYFLCEILQNTDHPPPPLYPLCSRMTPRPFLDALFATDSQQQ
jgi:hypothetical protein